MKKLKFARNFTFSDAILKQKADEMIHLLDRDFEDFAERGYTAAAKNLFMELRDQAENIPSDEILEAKKMMVTEQKVAAKIALQKTMRTILNMAANHFGARSAKFRSFGSTKLSRKREVDMARVYKIMGATASEHLEEMEEVGMTQILIDRLKIQGETFDECISAVTNAIIERNFATEKRIETNNALYHLLIKYASIGKDIFYETSEAKYNDYVIYDSPRGKSKVDVPI